MQIEVSMGKIIHKWWIFQHAMVDFQRVLPKLMVLDNHIAGKVAVSSGKIHPFSDNWTNAHRSAPFSAAEVR